MSYLRSRARTEKGVFDRGGDEWKREASKDRKDSSIGLWTDKLGQKEVWERREDKVGPGGSGPGSRNAKLSTLSPP